MTKTAAKTKKPAAKKAYKADGPKVDLYAVVTDKIVAALEAGVRPWMKPWNAPAGGSFGGQLPRRVTGQAYTGINVVLLWAEASDRGYANPTWMTFKQAIELKGGVRKGEKGTTIVYASKFKKDVDDGKGGTKEAWIPFLKSYTVFNVEQIDGLPEKFYLKAEEPVTVDEAVKAKLERIEHADAFFLATGGVVKHGGGRAFFTQGGDYIQMPEFDSFKEAEGYYATLGHEFVHWTGSDKRLNRVFGAKFGDEAYAAEELVAELGSAFLCATLGITPEVREDHAAYIQSWLKVLKGDKRFIFTAASLATKAVEHLSAYSEEDADLGEPDTIIEAVEEDAALAMAA
ncbi:DNA primase [Bajunvirus bajun]|uniref:DNA primase n=1 Tax=Brevundimonas phage vB_BgoS-Bajun TaxID=2948594 RepID=A0A9E7N6Y7_9CAUD|nr:DNA primase [Brevundimonas phage vB_BgoS-Bajun]